MVSPQGEDAPAAQEVEVACALAVPEVRSLGSREADIVANHLEDTHHLFVQVARMQGVAVRLMLGEGRRHVETHRGLPGLDALSRLSELVPARGTLQGLSHFRGTGRRDAAPILPPADETAEDAALDP